MPETPLTDILQDFRSYRPGNHREFLEWVRNRAEHVGVKKYAVKDKVSAKLYLHALNQVRDFRWRHWCFTREYVLKKSAHPTATGGSPIVLVSFPIPPFVCTLSPAYCACLERNVELLASQWLPNQLFSVYDQMIEIEEIWRGLPGCGVMMDKVHEQKATLRKEVQKYCSERSV